MLSAGVRRNGTAKDRDTASRHPTPRDSAQLQAMAELAEAEAAEADALAAAARARARALRLRRQAQLAAATAQHDPRADAVIDSSAHAPQPNSGSMDLDPLVDTAAAGGGRSTRVAADTPSDDPAIDGDAEAASAAVVGDAAVSMPLANPRRPGRRGFAIVAVSVAVIVILAALAGSALIVLEHRHASAQRQRAAEFEAAARQGVVTLTSLDFHHAKQSVQRIVDNSTGAFRDDFQKTADDFVKLLNDSKVVEQGSVRAVAVDRASMTPDSAVVLVVSTSDVTDAAGSKRDSRSFRLRVTVTRDGDQLKMTKVEFVW